MSRYCLETPRLEFRPLTHEDEEDVVALNQDPKVMHFFPDVMSVVQSQAYIEKSMAHFNTYGYSNYAVELKETNTFIGVMGLLKIGFEHELKGQVEIGWRLKKRLLASRVRRRRCTGTFGLCEPAWNKRGL